MKRTGEQEHDILARWCFHPSRSVALLWALDAMCRASGLKRHDCLVVVARLLAIILERWQLERAKDARSCASFERVIAIRVIGDAPATAAGREEQAASAGEGAAS